MLVEEFKDNDLFIELCKQILLQQFLEFIEDGNSADCTNPLTGDTFRFKLVNKTLQLFTVEKL